jgi:hypothetical protein
MPRVTMSNLSQEASKYQDSIRATIFKINELDLQLGFMNITVIIVCLYSDQSMAIEIIV